MAQSKGRGGLDLGCSLSAAGPETEEVRAFLRRLRDCIDPNDVNADDKPLAETLAAFNAGEERESAPANWKRSWCSTSRTTATTWDDRSRLANDLGGRVRRISWA